MGCVIACLVLTAGGFAAGFLVCRHNYKWVKNVEEKAIKKAKDTVNKL